jgi:hypothetical protein
LLTDDLFNWGDESRSHRTAYVSPELN